MSRVSLLVFVTLIPAVSAVAGPPSTASVRATDAVTVCVTNHAGGVLSGALTAVTNGAFTLAGRTLPLNVLPASEQRRLKALAGLDVRPAKERQRAKLLDAELRRIDLRLAAGEITESVAADLRRAARAACSWRSTE